MEKLKSPFILIYLILILPFEITKGKKRRVKKRIKFLLKNFF